MIHFQILKLHCSFVCYRTDLFIQIISRPTFRVCRVCRVVPHEIWTVISLYVNCKIERATKYASVLKQEYMSFYTPDNKIDKKRERWKKAPVFKIVNQNCLTI